MSETAGITQMDISIKADKRKSCGQFWDDDTQANDQCSRVWKSMGQLLAVSNASGKRPLQWLGVYVKQWNWMTKKQSGPWDTGVVLISRSRPLST